MFDDDISEDEALIAAAGPDPLDVWLEQQMKKDSRRLGCRHRSEAEVTAEWSKITLDPNFRVGPLCPCCHGPSTPGRQRKTCVLCIRRQGWMKARGVSDWSEMQADVPSGDLEEGEKGAGESCQ